MKYHYMGLMKNKLHCFNIGECEFDRKDTMETTFD